jgi:hypothetical protein
MDELVWAKVVILLKLHNFGQIKNAVNALTAFLLS